MIAIKLNDLRPLDVLLSSGDAKVSKANRFMQSLIRRGSAAPYSHAALFISPYLVLESLDESGVVLTDLFAPAANPHGTQPSSLDQYGIHARSVGRNIELYAILPGVDAVEARRYKPVGNADFIELYRRVTALHDQISAVYLAQYPAFVRLARTARLLSDATMTALERLGVKWEGKVITGPFCSELVVSILATVDPIIRHKFDSYASASPSDLYNEADLFETKAIGFKVSKVEDLPGIPTSEIYYGLETVSAKLPDQLHRWLKINTLQSQAWNSLLLQLSSTMPAIAHKMNNKNENDDLPESIHQYQGLYLKIMERMRSQWLRHMNEHIRDATIVHKWMKLCNECAETCPQLRRDGYGASGGLANSYQDAADVCRDIRQCSRIDAPTWSFVCATLEKNLQTRENAV